MNTHISIIGALTGEQFIELVKILVTGGVIVALAYGAYKNGYVLQGSNCWCNYNTAINRAFAEQIQRKMDTTNAAA